jgi:squalene-hopene/tetraprenyl-beta-curcumene cyclase
VLRAFETVAQTAQEYCQRAVAWLRAVQNQDGGFGESIASYYDSKRMGQGISTPSQTAWGLIGLLAGTCHEAQDTSSGNSDGHEVSSRDIDGSEGHDGDASVSRAVAHLIEHQNPDGSWDENEFTGTGFPCVFYLKYHLYRNYFPLYALSRYRNQRSGAREFRAFEIRPKTLRMNGSSRPREVVRARGREQAAEPASEMEQASP